VRRKLRRLASSSRNARATVQGSDGRLPVILRICAARRVPPTCRPVRACLAACRTRVQEPG